MLPRANRVTLPGDFRIAMRRGRRVSTDWAVIHVAESSTPQVRFGFVVSKSVGPAVTRNLVKRRLRAASRELVPTLPAGTDVIVRALPGSDRVDWVTLQSELAAGVGRIARSG